MKIYFEAGLKELALYSGFRGETLNSLKNCTNVKRTHAFFLQSMEVFIGTSCNSFLLAVKQKIKNSTRICSLLPVLRYVNATRPVRNKTQMHP